MTSNLIYAKPGNAYMSAVVCTLEGEEIVIRDGSSVTRLEPTPYVLDMVRGNCADFDVELGTLGLQYRAEWVAQMEAHTTKVIDQPEFAPETLGKVAARQLHLKLARAGHGQGYDFCTKLLDRPVPSLALLTLEEAVAVKDALTAGENSYLEHYHVPEVSLTNPVHGKFRLTLDPNQSGVSARAKRFFQ